MAKREQTISEVASLGGHARAAKLTPEQRSKIARKAAKARWAKVIKDTEPVRGASNRRSRTWTD